MKKIIYDYKNKNITRRKTIIVRIYEQIVIKNNITK